MNLQQQQEPMPNGIGSSTNMVDLTNDDYDTTTNTTTNKNDANAHLKDELEATQLRIEEEKLMKQL